MGIRQTEMPPCQTNKPLRRYANGAPQNPAIRIWAAKTESYGISIIRLTPYAEKAAEAFYAENPQKPSYAEKAAEAFHAENPQTPSTQKIRRNREAADPFTQLFGKNANTPYALLSVLVALERDLLAMGDTD